MDNSTSKNGIVAKMEVFIAHPQADTHNALIHVTIGVALVLGAHAIVCERRNSFLPKLVLANAALDGEATVLRSATPATSPLIPALDDASIPAPDVTSTLPTERTSVLPVTVSTPPANPALNEEPTPTAMSSPTFITTSSPALMPIPRVLPEVLLRRCVMHGRPVRPVAV
jgi:hypothetical protein